MEVSYLIVGNDYEYVPCVDMKEAMAMAKQWKKEGHEGEISIYKLVKTIEE